MRRSSKGRSPSPTGVSSSPTVQDRCRHHVGPAAPGAASTSSDTVPATLVVVPEWPTESPQVLSVPPASYRSVTNLIAVIAERLAAKSSTAPPRHQLIGRCTNRIEPRPRSDRSDDPFRRPGVS